MPKQIQESLEELNRQKEDIEALLSSLEDAYAEAEITEEHYREVKEKNQKKLDEIISKIESIRKRQEEAKKKEKDKDSGKTKKTKKGKPKKQEEEKKPESKPEEMETTEEKDVEEVLLEPAATGQPVREEPRIEGVSKISKEELKQMLNQIVKEAKLVDIAEIQPKIEKLSVDIEKIKAFLDAIKDEKKSGDERFARISEELGELRSTVHSNDGRISELEMKIKDM